MKGFYVHIDSIFDIRAGIIRRMNPELYAELIKNGYHQRKGDFFKGINPEEFRKLYQERDANTLPECTITNIFQFLYPQVADTMKEYVAVNHQEHQRPFLDVNVWPYELSDEEMAMLRSLVYMQMRGIIGVNVFSKPIETLTPAKCAENYHLMVMYDFADYLNAHSSALIKDPKPYLMLVAPMVYINNDPETHDETIDQLKQGINSLALLEAGIQDKLCVKFVNVEVFSIVYPDDRVLKVDLPDDTRHITIEELDRKLMAQKKRIPEA
jgi:hypothetical protein